MPIIDDSGHRVNVKPAKRKVTPAVTPNWAALERAEEAKNDELEHPGRKAGGDSSQQKPVAAVNTTARQAAASAVNTPSVTAPVDYKSAVREAVATLAKSRAESNKSVVAAYSDEAKKIQGLIDSQNAAAEKEKAAQLALEKRNRESAYDAVSKEWERYGVDPGEVRSVLKKLAPNDYTNGNTMAEAVRTTKSWAARFGAVTKARAKNGQTYINEGEILGLEDSYRQVMSAAGLPKGFYDSPKDFQNWIANGVSVKEISERVELAEQAVANTDPDYIKSFKNFYGIKKGDLTAYFLDRKRGTEVLSQQIKAAELGSEAKETGIHVGVKYAESLVDKGVSREQARSAFNTVAEQKADWQRLAKLGGENITERSLVEDSLSMAPSVTRKKERLVKKEQGKWSGSGAASEAFNNVSSGSY